MELAQRQCEKCSMAATHTYIDETGLVHAYCEHHAPSLSVRIGGENGDQSWTKFLPIIIIFSIISLFTIVSTIYMKGDLEFAMRMMMFSFFLIFGLFKVFNLRAFADAYATYDILAMRSKLYSYSYPFIELGLAALYLFDIGGVYRDIFTFVIMTFSAYGVYLKLRNKEEVPCACLGMIFRLPMTKITLAEDTLMATEALIMILMTIV